LDTPPNNNEAERTLEDAGREQFAHMVDSVGIKVFSAEIGLSTRQVNRILSGAQPNPVTRLLKCLQASLPEAGDAVLDSIAQEMGGYFVRDEGTLDEAAVQAVKECAEAIAAISDGHISKPDEIEIREAIAALMALSRLVRETGKRDFTPPA
jgi:class 3 adenylate cyclase